jgi:hypothetical protein
MNFADAGVAVLLKETTQEAIGRGVAAIRKPRPEWHVDALSALVRGTARRHP